MPQARGCIFVSVSILFITSGEKSIKTIDFFLIFLYNVVIRQEVEIMIFKIAMLQKQASIGITKNTAAVLAALEEAKAH